MKDLEFENVSLDNIGKGVASELFSVELQKVIKNIADINTPAKDIREISLKIKFKPNEEREHCEVSISCASKLPGLKPAASFVHVIGRHGNTMLVQDKFDQAEMFSDENVKTFTKESKEA